MEIKIDPHTLQRAEERGASAEGITMQILHDAKTDLLYRRLDDHRHHVINRRLADDIVLDIGDDERIIGIEILDASKHLNLGRLLLVEYTELSAA